MLDGGAWLEQDVDILIPSALENQITGENVGKVSERVKIVAEGANGPTTPEADAVLEDRGVFMIPDFLANAGGVTCSYFEQVQCNMNYFWEMDEVLGKLDLKMTAAYQAISDWPASASSTCATRPTCWPSTGWPRPAASAAGSDPDQRGGPAHTGALRLQGGAP